MSNPQKAKGTRWETAVLRFLRAILGRFAYKPRAEGFVDIGDLHAWPFVIQAKDWKDWQAAIREGLDGAVRQAAAYHAATRPRCPECSSGPEPGPHDCPHRSYIAPIPVAVVKRARRSTGDAYAVMRLSDLAEVARRLNGADPS